ncbi:MAG: cation transporter [Phycisphaerales bacterium]|nr:cation transporter [Phycisphaerales bacterium]
MRETNPTPTNDSIDQNDNSFVNRRFLVEGLHHDLHAQTINHAFAQQSGVRSIRIDAEHAHIHIGYDNTMIGVETLIEILRNVGCPPRQRFWDRLKYGWWRYLDENARGNAKNPGAPCCGNPTTLYAQRRRH